MLSNINVELIKNKLSNFGIQVPNEDKNDLIIILYNFLIKKSPKELSLMFKPIRPLTNIKYRTKTRYVADIIRSYDFYTRDNSLRQDQCENYYTTDTDLDILNEIFHFNDPIYNNISKSIDGYNRDTCILETGRTDYPDESLNEEIFFINDDPIFKIYKLLNEIQNKINEVLSFQKTGEILPLPEINLECVARMLNGKSQMNILDKINELETKIKLRGSKTDNLLDEHKYLFKNAISNIKADKSIIFDVNLRDNGSLLSNATILDNDENELHELNKLSQNVEGNIDANRIETEIKDKMLSIVNGNKKPVKNYKISTIWNHHVGKNVNESFCSICKKIITKKTSFYVLNEQELKNTIDSIYLVCKKCKTNLGDENLIDYCKKNYPKCNLFTEYKLKNGKFYIPPLVKKYEHIEESLDKLILNSL